MDAFAEHPRQHGANVTGPVDQPWNVHEVTVVDPDGYRLVFTSPIFFAHARSYSTCHGCTATSSSGSAASRR